LDTRELVPHRRPTCIAEDGDGNLWIGTEWDGLVRLNAQARKYHNREPEKNKKDGTEWKHYHGLRKVTWASKKIERPVGPEGVIHKIVRLTNGRVVAASWWSLFESNSTVKKAPAE
jgi:hypothetical protein